MEDEGETDEKEETGGIARGYGYPFWAVCVLNVVVFAVACIAFHRLFGEASMDTAGILRAVLPAILLVVVGIWLAPWVGGILRRAAAAYRREKPVDAIAYTLIWAVFTGVWTMGVAFPLWSGVCVGTSAPVGTGNAREYSVCFLFVLLVQILLSHSKNTAELPQSSSGSDEGDGRDAPRGTNPVSPAVARRGNRGVSSKGEACEAENYREAARRGDAEAQYRLGWCYEDGRGVDKDMREALHWLRKAAGQGHAAAQNHLGWCYRNGVGVEQDAAEAVRWFRSSAELGYASGQCNLGLCYRNGYGVDKDNSEAIKYFRMAAEQGYAKAQYYLGEAYFLGNQIKQDTTEAVRWFHAAAEQGLAEAQQGLGMCYVLGNGTEQDETKAVTWFRKAAKQGLAAAQDSLGWCYYYGKGVEKDATEATKWFRLAAEQGDATAQHSLGMCFLLGRGVEKDEAKAKELLRSARTKEDA